MVETTIIFDRQMRESDRFCFMIPRQSVVVVAVALLALLLTLCGLTGRKLPRGGPGLSGLVHEEAHPSISYHHHHHLSIHAGRRTCSLCL